VSQVASSPADAGRGDPGASGAPARPGGRPPSGPPVRPRSGRRPLPPLVFLTVLALAAAGTWVYVLKHSTDQQNAQAAACASAEAAPPSLDPGSVSVRVLNATDTKGLANTVSQDLKDRGFTVTDPDNDRSGRKVTGVGEIRHGKRGDTAARYVAAYLPGAKDYVDTRATASVDLVIGPDFKQLASAGQVAAAVRRAASASAASC
jgi:LytR cell envelope-related transcriptional attenuator